MESFSKRNTIYICLLLLQALREAGMGEPVSRLLWVSGRETILACYHVGIYSDKELIGQGNAALQDIHGY